MNPQTRDAYARSEQRVDEDARKNDAPSADPKLSMGPIDIRTAAVCRRTMKKEHRVINFLGAIIFGTVLVIGYLDRKGDRPRLNGHRPGQSGRPTK